MAIFHRHLTAAWLSAVAMFTSANGQPDPAATRQLNFTVFAAEPIKNLSYIPQPGGAQVALAFYPTARSPRYVFRGPSLLQFLDIDTSEVRAEVSVPSTVRTALFILSAVESTSSGAVHFRVDVVDEDTSTHEPGTLLVLNFSGLELAGTLGRRPISLQPGFNGPMRVEGAAAITLRTPFRGRSYQAFAETIPLDRFSRGLLLLLPPYRPGSLEVQSRVLLDVVTPTDVSSRP
jgi:hypothetical protein